MALRQTSIHVFKFVWKLTPNASGVVYRLRWSATFLLFSLTTSVLSINLMYPSSDSIAFDACVIMWCFWWWTTTYVFVACALIFAMCTIRWESFDCYQFSLSNKWAPKTTFLMTFDHNAISSKFCSKLHESFRAWQSLRYSRMQRIKSNGAHGVVK